MPCNRALCLKRALNWKTKLLIHWGEKKAVAGVKQGVSLLAKQLQKVCVYLINLNAFLIPKRFFDTIPPSVHSPAA